jgi:hypothetical protein
MQNLGSNFWIADVGRTQIFEWFSKFKSGVSSDEGVKCSEHPLTRKMDGNVNGVEELILVKRRITVC